MILQVAGFSLTFAALGARAYFLEAHHPNDVDDLVVMSEALNLKPQTQNPKPLFLLLAACSET